MSYLHQTPEEIIKNADAPQRIVWNHIFLTFGERATIRQLCLFGVAAGELFTYQARKMYFAYEIFFTGSMYSANFPYMLYYDENNVSNYGATNSAILWDITAAAPKSYSNSMTHTNMLFSRVTTNFGIGSVKFIGYRITY